MIWKRTEATWGSGQISDLFRFDAAFRGGIDCQRRDSFPPASVIGIERAAENSGRKTLNGGNPPAVRPSSP
jgi:hypothetical protein